MKNFSVTFRVSSIVVLFILLSSGPVQAAVSPEDIASQKLTQLLSGIGGMSAQFQQQVKNAGGEEIQRTQGLMKLKRPGKFYWYTQAPFEQKITSDGRHMWIYDIDLEQVIIQDVAPELGQTPANLLSGQPEKVVQGFKVSGRELIGGIWHFSLLSRQNQALFISLELQFKQQSLVFMRVTDNLNQVTEVQFKDIKLNPIFSKNTFSLSFPEGLDVIDNSQSSP